MIFLDEPTLGLDVTAQAAIRDFIRAYNTSNNATVLLTSHYMADVSALARRILVIEHGKLVYDGDLRALIDQVAPYRMLRLTLSSSVDNVTLRSIGEIESTSGLAVTLRVPRHHTRDTAARALSELPVADVAIEDPPVEDIIRQVFKRGGELG
jgi:ABC-2 type transport system ATP-binding protein